MPHLVGDMTSEAAIAAAVTNAGSDDFGDDSWREGLAQSLAGFIRVPLTQAAREAAMRTIVQDLTTRLQVEQWFKRHPEPIQPIEGPVFVVGLPRTGTTALVAMMALDDRFRFLRAWEGRSPLAASHRWGRGNRPALDRRTRGGSGL